ncbi:two-component system sensor histidine kinase NtrB [Anaeromyxobacter terrae]|uniref:two-component system sensor histidine kinase NtrB n=1 Tax=Anaeromyxobacter terrae TaxID=2925406 RepID=UPI001F576CBC|nr:HAMP domain-containing sensor histidine kinase [Anaeromyxobacter sp. SG22]
MRWPSEDLLPVVFHLVAVAVLAATSYPAGRIAILALAAAVQKANYLTWRKRDIKLCVNADVDQLAWLVVASQACFFLTTGVAVAVTGGIHSPLLLTIMGAYVAAVSAVGDRPQTRLLLGATALEVGVIALLPRSLAGPELASPAYAFLTLMSVLGIGLLLAPVHARARKRRDAFARARKEMAADALARAQSLEQIGSKVAHELKNPLTGVKALVQLGLRNPAEASSHERLEIVEREVTRMQEILHNYLSFTRPLQAVTPRRVELGPLVSDALVVLSARADDARVRLYAQGDATLEADPRRLKEALLNLVANAIEATPPGGEVVVEVRPAGDDAEIVVRDNGRGMAAETLRHIGTPFFTTRDDGTGLGVVLARSVIAQHGGSLRYESEPGKGTRVKVTLPRVATGACDAACAARR